MSMLLPHAPARAHTFDGLAQSIVDYALKHARIVTAKRGESITRQGDPARCIYVIREGYTKLVSTSPDGHEVLVGVAGPRDAFGHAAVTEELRDYMVTATALTPVTAACWDRARALAIANEFPEVHQKLDAAMVRNLDLILGRLHLVSEGRVAQRLARALLELADRHGEPDALGIVIAPPLTRKDVASVVGTSLFTASRLLSQWEDDGLVSSSRAHLRILSTEGLRAIADAPSD